jgi:hypothetical protein
MNNRKLFVTDKEYKENIEKIRIPKESPTEHN